MNKQFGVIGYFAGQLHIRVRHTDKDLAAKTTAYLLRNRIPHTIQFTKNGHEIIEVIGDRSVLDKMKRLTIIQQINRLEHKLADLDIF
jgi:hypothetical protein